MADVNAQQPLIVDKLRLCQVLGWARTTLDKRLREDSNFPVLKAGAGKRDPWQFDANEVLAYVRSGALARSSHPTLFEDESPPDIKLMVSTEVLTAAAQATARTALPPPQVRAAERTPQRAVHGGEATAASRLKLAQALAAEDKIQTSRAELLQRHQVVGAVATLLAQIGKALDSLPEQILQVAGLEPRLADTIRDLIDDARRNAVNEFVGELGLGASDGF